MKKYLCLLLALVCILLSGCSAYQGLLDDPISEQYLTRILSAAQTQDAAAMKGLFFVGVADDATIEAAFAQLNALWGEAEHTYKAVGRYTKYNTSAAIQHWVESTYLVDCNGTKTYVFLARLPDDSLGASLIGLHWVDADAYDRQATPSGAISRIGEFNLSQWALLALSVLFFAFTVFTTINCIRAKIRRKPFWVLLILLGYGYLVFGWLTGGVEFRIGVCLIDYSRWTVSYTGENEIRILLPLGAAIYWFMRNRLMARYETYQKKRRGQGEPGLVDEQPELAQDCAEALTEEDPR